MCRIFKFLAAIINRGLINHKFLLTVAGVLLTVGLMAAIPDSTRSESDQSAVIEQVAPGNYKIAEISPFPRGVMGMAVNDDGVLFFSDTYSRLDASSAVYALAPPYSGDPVPTGITGRSVAGLMWHEEKLYVAFLNRNEIIIYDSELEFLESRVVDSPWGFATDGENVFVYTYYGQIGLITNNRVNVFTESLQYPLDMEFSGNESLWITEASQPDSLGRLLEVGFRGEVKRDYAQGIKYPFGLQQYKNGNLYVTDKESGVIYVVPPEGNTAIVTDEYASPICITVDHLGRLVVNCDHNGGMLLVIKVPQ